MGSLFGGKPDTSALDAQKKSIAAQEAKLEKDEANRLRKDEASKRSRTGRSGRKSLLSGLETGVKSEEDSKRESLG